MGNSYDEFLRRMICYREKMKLSQKEVSSLLGKTQSQQSKVELRKTVVSFEMLEGLVNAGWDIDFIITGKTGICIEENLIDYLCEKAGPSWKELKEVLLWIIGRELKKSNGFKDNEVKLEYELLKSYLGQEKPASALHEIRNIMGISQMSMSEKLGVNIKKYRNLEKGIVYPDAELLMLIYEISYCRPSTFFCKDGIDGYLLNCLWNQIETGFRREAREFMDDAMRVL